MAFWPDVHKGEPVNRSALLENDVRVRVWNADIAPIRNGVAVMIDYSQEMCGDAFPVVRYNPYLGIDRFFGVCEDYLEINTIGECVIDGVVEVRVGASLVDYNGCTFAEPWSDGVFRAPSSDGDGFLALRPLDEDVIHANRGLFVDLSKRIYSRPFQLFIAGTYLYMCGGMAMAYGDAMWYGGIAQKSLASIQFYDNTSYVYLAYNENLKELSVRLLPYQNASNIALIGAVKRQLKSGSNSEYEYCVENYAYSAVFDGNIHSPFRLSFDGGTASFPVTAVKVEGGRACTNGTWVNVSGGTVSGISSSGYICLVATWNDNTGSFSFGNSHFVYRAGSSQMGDFEVPIGYVNVASVSYMTGTAGSITTTLSSVETFGNMPIFIKTGSCE